MFTNTVICLTLLILSSLTESQILQNRQSWYYANAEQIPRLEAVRANPVIAQPSTLHIPIQSGPLGPKRPANLNDNQQIIWNRVVTSPSTYTTFENEYENIIRKYDSMVIPPDVGNSNYYKEQTEQFKRNDNNDIKNRQFKENKTEKSRRRKEQSVPFNNVKGKKHRKYRRSDEHNRKKKDNKPLGDNVINETKKGKNVNLDESLVIEELEKNFINNYNNEIIKNANAYDLSTPRIQEKVNQDVHSQKDKLLSFEKNRKTKQNNKKRNAENETIKNAKSAAIEYQTKYFGQEEFNKYLQNFMAGNISNPYYFPNDMYPYIFDSFYKASQDSMKSKNKNSNKRKNTKKPNKTVDSQNKEENCETVIELSPTFHEAIPVTITTGTGPKKDIYLNLKIKKKDLPPDIDLNAPANIDEDLKVESDDEYTPKPFLINLFTPLEDDAEYYPDFKLYNHAYLTSSEEEELNQIQKHQNDWDYYADKVKSYVEHSNKKSRTKTHVGFEPDFVNFATKKDKEVTDNTNMKVEMIYAPSRVVTYSQTEIETKNAPEQDENFWFKEGDTTIVLSRSINE